MAKESEKPKEPEPAADGPQMTIRKGRYVGVNGRAFDSIPFGERLVCRTGQMYEVRAQFSYLWLDPHFAIMFEWDGDPELVPAVNPGQVAAK